MMLKTFIAFLLTLSVAAQYPSQIPCRDYETCKNVLHPSQSFSCVSGFCMCVNNSTKTYQFCDSAAIVLSKPRGISRALKRICSGDEDCDHIEGAKCYGLQADKSIKICDCQPDMVMSSDNPRCLPVATEPSAKCTETTQCTAKLDGAECSDGRCRCRPTFHYAASHKRCILNKALGEPCKREEESCYQLADPDGTNALGCSERNVCKCLKNYIPVGKDCQYSGASRVVLKISLVLLVALVVIKAF